MDPWLAKFLFTVLLLSTHQLVVEIIPFLRRIIPVTTNYRHPHLRRRHQLTKKVPLTLIILILDCFHNNEALPSPLFIPSNWR